MIPTPRSESPIAITTEPVTIAGKNLRKGFKKAPSMPSKIPPTRQAPIIAPYAITPPPHAATVLFNTPRKPEEVPITIGTFPPTGPMENICTNVTIPAIIIAFCKRAVLSSAKPASAVSPHAPITMIRGVRFPMNIAITCCSPSGIA